MLVRHVAIKQVANRLGAVDLSISDEAIERLDYAVFNSAAYKDPGEFKLIYFLPNHRGHLRSIWKILLLKYSWRKK